MKVMENKSMERDGENLSPWQVNLESKKSSPVAEPETIYACIIIGAGITGITAGLILRKAGKEILIVDAHLFLVLCSHL